MREGTVPWPREAAQRYREAGYWRGRPLGGYVHEWAPKYGDAEAVTDSTASRVTYRELAGIADGLAVRLLDAADEFRTGGGDCRGPSRRRV